MRGKLITAIESNGRHPSDDTGSLVLWSNSVCGSEAGPFVLEATGAVSIPGRSKEGT